MTLEEKAVEFETRKFSFKTTSDRIVASREVKALILEINEVYKQNNDPLLMDLMKRLTVIKQKIEKSTIILLPLTASQIKIIIILSLSLVYKN